MLHAFTTVFFQVRSKKTKERFYRTFGPLLKLPLGPSAALFLVFGGIFLVYQVPEGVGYPDPGQMQYEKVIHCIFTHSTSKGA